MAITPFADSPRNGCWGDRPYAIIDWAGPSNYTQVSEATPPTGGQAITPANFGLVAGLEGIFMVGASTTGTYGVVAMQAGGQQSGLPNPTWILLWYYLFTGSEVVAGADLSTEKVRLIAFGPY
jgi:hypothetical protein